MATTLVYTVAAYIPFTKILSANINQDKTDIQNRLNWTGGTDTTTGLSGDNIQSNSVITEVAATGTIGGIIYTANSGQGTAGNSITVAYTAGGVVGLEVVSVVGSAISVQISSGVSTITQVRTAINASGLATNLVSATGTSATTVATTLATALTGGVTAGGLVRSTKLGLDTANNVIINSSTGTMTSEPQLSISRGGTGAKLTYTNSGDVLQVNSGVTALMLGPSPVPPALRVSSFILFS